MLKNLYLTEDKRLPSSLMGYGPLSIRCKVEYHIWFYFIHQKFFPQPLKGPSLERKNTVVVSRTITWYQINRRGWYCNHSFVASWWFSRQDVILKWNNKDKKLKYPAQTQHGQCVLNEKEKYADWKIQDLDRDSLISSRTVGTQWMLRDIPSQLARIITEHPAK